MNENEKKLFHELIAASRILVTTSRNAATVLSEEFESMITGPADAVDAVLSKCPVVPDAIWDGEFREEDCDEEHFSPDVPDALRSERANTGVRMTHRLTGLSVESSSKPTAAENRRVVLRALAIRVKHHAASQRMTDPLNS